MAAKEKTNSKHDPARLEIAKLLAQLVSEKFGLSDESVDQEHLYLSLERPPEYHLGDFSLPCFRFAKLLKKKPQLIALDLKAELENSSSLWVSHIEVVGAFLNIFINKEKLANYLLPSVLDQSLFKVFDKQYADTKVMVEFSQPNTHKEFHVGHGRNVCLGDVLSRLYSYNGYELTPVNYIGDEGTHVAKCLWQLAKESPEELAREQSGEWYGDKYKKANDFLKQANDQDKEQAQKEMSAILSELEAKKGSFYELWKKSRADCMKGFDQIYSWLGVHFDHVFFESELTKEAQEIVDEFLEKGLFTHSQGAVGIDMEEFKLGYFMVRKSDGTTLYITKDLVLARRKFNDFAIDRSIYVVGSEQNFHFQQLFKALDLMGFKNAKDCHHLSYAHVKLPSGKMSSRDGNVIAFSELVNLLTDELGNYLSKYKDSWSAEKIEETGKKLAAGALRYGMLVTDPAKEIIFDAKAWTSFEGHSGLYLMYSYSRTCSIVEKCESQGYEASVESLNLLSSKVEVELLKYLYDFNENCMQACDSHKPSILCNYLYNTCRSFNRFYAESSVLNAESADLRLARLALVKAFSTVLKQGLDLLGIDPPNRM